MLPGQITEKQMNSDIIQATNTTDAIQCGTNNTDNT